MISYDLRLATKANMLLDPIINRRNQLPELTFNEDIRPSFELMGKISTHCQLHVIETFLSSSSLNDTTIASLKSSPILQHDAVLPPPLHHITAQYPGQSISIPENSISNIIKVIEDIFFRQKRMKRDTEMINKYAVLSINDQATNANLRGARSIRIHDDTPFTRFDSIQLAPGLFHYLLNLSWYMLDIHRGIISDTGSETGSGADWIRVLGKTRHGGKHPNYHAVKATLMQILDGLLLEAWRLECISRGFTSIATFEASGPTAVLLMEMADSIHSKYSSTPTREECYSDPDNPRTFDECLYNIRLFIRDLLYFRTLHAAVKSGDFGRVEQLLGLFAIWFAGAGAWNYRNETLHLLLNLRKVWTPEFTYVLLCPPKLLILFELTFFDDCLAMLSVPIC